MIQAKAKAPMTVERLRDIWLSPYGRGKKPDYSRLYPHYHPDCRFQDSIQAYRGKGKFIEMCERLGKRCQEIYMDVHAVAGSGNVFFVEWTMTMRFKMSPLTPLKGATKVVVDDDGLLLEHRDYYDLWGDSLDAVPLVGKAYRWFLVNVMG